MAKYRQKLLRGALFGMLTLTGIAATGGTSNASHADGHIVSVERFSSFATDGEWLAWTALPPGGPYDGPHDLFAMNLETRETTSITNALAGASIGSVRLVGDVLIWKSTGEPSTAGDIVGRNLMSGDSFVVAEADPDGSAWPVGLSDTWVVYSIDQPDNVQFFARNVHTLAEPMLLPIPTTAEFAGFHDDRLLWSERTGTGVEQTFFTFTIGDGAPTTIPAPASAHSPYFAGDHVIYITTDSDAPGTPLTYTAYNLVTGDSKVVTIPSGYGPAYAGSRAPYMILAGGADGSSSIVSIFAYDLDTDVFYSLMVSRGNTSREIVDDQLFYTVLSSDGTFTDIFMAPLDAFLSPVYAIDPATAPDSWTFFPETGHYLHPPFRNFWHASGGLPVFGYPLTEQFKEQSTDQGVYLTTQFYERQRFEYHPQNAGTPYEVLLGRLGDELLRSQFREWETFPKADPATPNYVPETGHAIAEQFYGYWTSHGLEFGDAGVSYRESLALFGYPLSEPMLETNADGDTVLTQYFERAVFEHHPDLAGTEYEVLLRRVGVEMLWERQWP